MKQGIKLILTGIILSMSVGLLQGCKPEPTVPSDSTPVQTQTTNTVSIEEWQTLPEDSGGIALPITKEKINSYEFMLAENPAFPFQDTFVQVPELEKRTNVKLNVQAKPQTSYQTSLTLAMNTGELPDILGGGGTYIVDQGNRTVEDKLFLNVMDYIEDMPNFQRVLEDYPELKQYMRNSKELYSLPSQISDERDTTFYKDAFMIRTDVLKKDGLNVPTTYDELYDTLKKLKELHSGTYPWISRGGGHLDTVISGLAPGWNVPTQGSANSFKTFNPETRKWESALEKSEFRDLIEFLIKCYDKGNGVLDQEFFVDSTPQWEEKMISGKGFFTVDWANRTDWATQKGRAAGNPEYTMEAMIPPKGIGEPVTFSNPICKSFISIKADVKDPHTLMKFIDYMYYSKAGSILGVLGVEGQTFKILEDGKWDFIPDPSFESTALTEYRVKYGVSTDNMFGVRPVYYGLERAVEDQLNKEAKMLKGHTIFPLPFIIKDSEDYEEEDTLNQTYGTLFTYIEEKLAQMIMGDLALSEWDNLIKNAKTMGLDKYLEIDNRAQEKMDKALGISK